MNEPGYYNEQTIAEVKRLAGEGQYAHAYQLLAEPLHEALYKRQDFMLLDELPVLERLILSFDYVQTQVQQGGFIQLIQNNYVSLLVTVIEALQALPAGTEMIPVLDDVLKVYVLNRDALSRETSVEEFSKLYAEFQEFGPLEQRFEAALPAVQREVVERALS